MSTDFRVRFWGVRGTITCPGHATIGYGGNTPCVEVRCGRHRIILDAGTGIRSLGKAMMEEAGDQPVHVLLSHTHFDHIIGLPFFRPAYSKGRCFELWAGHLKPNGNLLRDTLCRLMEPPYFPVPLGIMHACMAFHDFDVGSKLDTYAGVKISTLPLNHPGGATGYRIEHSGKSLCYITDTEHPEIGLDESIVAFVRDADVMIYDATYTDEEYPLYRGWGHSTWQMGVRLCRAAQVKRLVTFHHDPDHDDAVMDRIAVALNAAMRGSLVAREGMELEL
jgi:phosphoribosyl 1,2-cyclic phosphodiesterase